MAEIPTSLLVVAGALRGSDGRWLLHRRPPHKHHGGLWEFPGGKVEPGETPANALVRELMEELGVAIERSMLRPIAFAESEPRDGSPGLVILLYTVTSWKGEAQALESGAELGWFAPEQMPVLAMPPLDVILARRVIAAAGEGIGP